MTQAVTYYLNDYHPPKFQIDNVDLTFTLGEEETRVIAHLKMRRTRENDCVPLLLDADQLELISVKLNDVTLMKDEYECTGYFLKIMNVPAQFELIIENKIHPEKNTALNGLYKSKKLFCTQCEPQGFRRITYFLDKPDVLTTFTTTIIADKKRYPILLSNGNCLARQDLNNGNHKVTWQDPFKKPSYLFALVAGDLDCLEDYFVTMSGRKVTLQIFVEPGLREKCHHAMSALKNSMRWDEEHYGCEYDLDIFMIVAVSDFNMGAMENKGLNIFNSKYILADEKTATDSDYLGIESVVAHEYFHNWTGNRVTCRDWFQLSLKEGLTIFRDQNFSADMHDHALMRIRDVRSLRAMQFPEDAGPMAHPVRPPSFIEINNFYTATIYNKGAEVIRMMHTFIGKDRYRAGTDLYFKRHDGQAVTIEDFAKALEEGGKADFSQMRRWYDQAGTPELNFQFHYDARQKTFTIDVEQHCRMTPDKLEKLPFYMPIITTLLDPNGAIMPMQLTDESSVSLVPKVLIFKDKKQSFVFKQVEQKPVASVLQHFSAPVKYTTNHSLEDRVFLAKHDNDLFNRWESIQQLVQEYFVASVTALQQQKPVASCENLAIIFSYLLQTKNLHGDFVSQCMRISSEEEIAEWFAIINPDLIHEAREQLLQTLSQILQADLMRIYETHHDLSQDQDLSDPAMAKRSLKNTCLGWLMYTENNKTIKQWAYKQFVASENMTNKIGALSALNTSDCEERTMAFESFYQAFKKDDLVVDKWLTLEAQAMFPQTFTRIKNLLQHSAFQLSNPNKIRSLIGTWCKSNPFVFHQADGAGYALLADYVIELNQRNPQIAARLVAPLSRFNRFDAARSTLMRGALEKIAAISTLSKDVFEIVDKSLRV